MIGMKTPYAVLFSLLSSINTSKLLGEHLSMHCLWKWWLHGRRRSMSWKVHWAPFCTPAHTHTHHNDIVQICKLLHSRDFKGFLMSESNCLYKEDLEKLPILRQCLRARTLCPFLNSCFVSHLYRWSRLLQVNFENQHDRFRAAWHADRPLHAHVEC